jgi:hypothetical protein
MILDRRQSRWAVGAGAAAVISLAAYIVYVVLSPNGARGGSLAGLFFAALGTGVIVFECLLSLRKKYPASPLGRVKTWLSAHVWLGLLSFLLILEHSGFRWGHSLAAVLMWIFAAILVSGIFGVVMQNYIPRRMTELVPRETIYEQMPTVVRGLRLEADQRVEFLTADLVIPAEEDVEFDAAGGVKRYFDPEQKKGPAERLQATIDKRKASPQIEIGESARLAVKEHYLQEVRPFLKDTPAPASRRLLGRPELVAAYFNRLRTIMPVAAHDVLRDLEEIAEERRQLLVQRRFHLWLHTWLLVHVPLSFAFLVLTAVHAVLSLRY